MSDELHGDGNDVAIVGMEARLPGASTLDRLWKNLRGGVESVRFFSDDPPVVRGGLAHVKAAPLLDDIDLFDAGFFGFTPREAEVMDPQIRLFLEAAWTVLERSGCDPLQYPGRIGVFAGSGSCTYLTSHVLPNFALLQSSSGGLPMYGVFNDRDALATLVAYKLDLTGPAFAVQTFCSTSLVAVHLACQSLLSGECDMALAGASSINVHLHRGYVFQEGGILSPDGHTRSFDEKAEGTVFGNGVGVVALKRLADARTDGDEVHAVIRGSAINNDGARKAGYTAPSVAGQAKAIAEAIAVAGVEPESISYVETHGTATAVGDPIEVEALTRAFRAGTARRGFCRIGSVKANFGHLDRTAGMASLIKTVLMLEHREIPPLVHFERPNPMIDFASSPFVVARELQAWEAGESPRRAGVSSLGVGGTNAHLVLEEAEPRPPSGPRRKSQLVVLSARTEAALEASSRELAAHLRSHPGENLADVAHTLLVGRRRFEHRRFVVADDAADAASALESPERGKAGTGFSRSTERPVVFLFPGQGAQYAGMAQGLYESESVFRRELDACCESLRGPLGLDLRTLLHPPAGEAPAADERLRETSLTQPALFAVEYALARLWMSFGIVPVAMIGHSIGEYVAATLAGVFALEEALGLVAERGRLMQSMPPGAMLGVPMPPDELAPLLGTELVLAAVNGPSLCAVSGPAPAVDALEEELRRRETPATRLHTSHAFHSPMMDPILEPFRDRVARASLQPPRVPFVSNLTGTWITDDEARSPGYWADHLRHTVRFAPGVATLLSEPERVFLEVGPGTTLTTLVRLQSPPGTARVAVPSLRRPREKTADLRFLLAALGQLWVAGSRVPPAGLFAGERRHRIALPTYPFQRERYWLDVEEGATGSAGASARKDPADWFSLPIWKTAVPVQAVARPNGADRGGAWLVLGEGNGVAERLARRLRRQGDVVVSVRPGPGFSGNSRDGYVIDPAAAPDYERLLRALGEQGRTIGRVVHALAAGSPRDGELTGAALAAAQTAGFYSVLYLVQALGQVEWTQPLQLKVLTTRAQEVLPEDPLEPGKTTLHGLMKVVPQERHNVTAAIVDLDETALAAEGDALDPLLAELRGNEPGVVAAWRRGVRYVQGFEPVRLAAPEGRPPLLRESGVYLITGGLGGVTFVLAATLAHVARARLVLTGRTSLPERGGWDAWRRERGDLDPVSQKILRVQALEQMGAEVLLVSADVADPAAMAAAVAAAAERFGALHGVIHGAGIVGGGTFRPIDEIGPQECEAQFHPKLLGLAALDRALGDRPLDFVLLTSSLSSVLGGFAYGAYAAANTFMDGYTRWRRRSSRARWLSVNWDEWRLGEPSGDEDAQGLRRYAMSPIEGGGAFLRLLGLGPVPQVVVSTGDLAGRIAQWVRLEGLHDGSAGKAGRREAPRHSRPALPNPYVAPTTPTEQKVARIWADLLGVDRVGLQDNFFELGGHSLLAIQVVTRMKAELAAAVSVASLFEAPTVASLARLIDGARETKGRFDQSSDRGRRRKEEGLRRRERVEERP